MGGAGSLAGHVAWLKTKITTPAYAETRAFYRDVWGFEEIESWDSDGDVGVIFRVGADALLEIYQGEGAPMDGVSLQFRVPALAAFLEDLVGRWPHDGPTPRPWGSTYAYLTDPAGVAIIVYEGGN